MLKSKNFLSLLLLLIPLLSFPVAAEVISSRVDLSGVTRIQMDGANELHFSQGDDEHVTITTEQEMLERIDARVEGNLLHLSRKRQGHGWGWFSPDWVNNQFPVHFEVQLKDLSQLRINGAGKVTMDDLVVDKLTLNVAGSGGLDLARVKTGDLRLKIAGSGDLEAVSIDADSISVQIFGSGKLVIPDINTEEIAIAVSGSGDIEVDRLEAEDLEITINGSGDATLAGKVDSQRLEVNGSGKYRAYGLASRTADVEVNGSGSVEVNVQEQLSTQLSKGSEVSYQGRPDMKVETSGGGRVRRAD